MPSHWDDASYFEISGEREAQDGWGLERGLPISHEAIYPYGYADKRDGGDTLSHQ